MMEKMGLTSTEFEALRQHVMEAEDGRHLASLRPLPTTKPHLLGDVFPFLCDRDVPKRRANKLSKAVLAE